MQPLLRYILFHFFILLPCILFAQEEEIHTLRIVKAQNPVRLVQSDTVQPSPMYILETAITGRINQSFFMQGWGGEIGIQFRCANVFSPDVELQFCRVNGHFDLSGYNYTGQPVEDVKKNTQTRMDLVKLPLTFTFGHWTGNNYTPYIETGLAPSFLVDVRNIYDRIEMDDMNRFNCAYLLGGGIHLFNNLRLGLRFSGDILSNLKDNTVYDIYGEKAGRQNSRNYLISVSAAWKLKRYYAFGKQE